MGSVEDIEFKTLDGLTLRGQIYHAKEYGPGMILCPGFNCVKEMNGLPSVAEGLQETGITALIYDPRSVGLSDGTPRNDVDPFKQVEDYSDAVTFLSKLSTVDSSRVSLWGFSISGAVALCAASFDKRVKSVIAVCPAAEYIYSHEKIAKVMAKCMKDRESQIKGNAPYYLQMLNESGENPAGFDFGYEREKAAKMVQSGVQLAPNHVNRTTIQSYHKLLMWHPWAMWKNLSPTPVMFIVPELDKLCPMEVQLRHFDSLQGPKRCHIQKGSGHMDILEGEGFGELMKLQIDFIRDVQEGKI